MTPAPARNPRPNAPQTTTTIALAERVRAAARRLAFVAVGAIAALGCTPSTHAAAPVAPADTASNHTPDTTRASRPDATVVVAIVIDQHAAWIAKERWPALPKDGGFARLLSEGAYADAMRYEHANTATAAGHASLFTGTWPSRHGIFGNQVFDFDKKKEASFLSDPKTHCIGPSGAQEGACSSLARLGVESIADALREASPQANIFSFSLKDRGALVGGGQKPTLTAWFDRKAGGFVTSSAVGASLPRWFVDRTNEAALRKRLPETWKPLDGAPAPYTTTNRASGDFAGIGREFPHAFGPDRSPIAWVAHPGMNDVLLEIGLDALDHRPHPDATTLLAISLSSPDYIGHFFGPNSPEYWDMLRRLDRALAQFMTGLDQRFTKDGWSMVVSADHGVVTPPEDFAALGTPAWCTNAGGSDLFERPCTPGERIRPDKLRDTLDAEARRALGRAGLIAAVVDPFILLAPDAASLGDADRAKLDRVITSALAKTPGILRTYTKRDWPKDCAKGDPVDKLVCRTADGSWGDYYVVTKSGSFFDTMYTPGMGVNHGAPYAYDLTVPLVVRAPSRVQAGSRITRPVRFSTFTRTVSALLGAPAPKSAEAAEVLLER